MNCFKNSIYNIINFHWRINRFRDGEGKAYGGGFHDSSVKTNAGGQQGQYGNGDGYHTGGGQIGEAVNNQLYGGSNVVAGAPYLVSTVDPLTSVIHLPPQYVQQTGSQYVTPIPIPQYVTPIPQYVTQAPQYVGQVPYVSQIPAVTYQNNIPQLPSVVQPQPGSILPPYNVRLPALSLTARSPSGQYVVPMPPKLYVDKPNDTDS